MTEYKVETRQYLDSDKEGKSWSGGYTEPTGRYRAKWVDEDD